MNAKILMLVLVLAAMPACAEQYAIVFPSLSDGEGDGFQVETGFSGEGVDIWLFLASDGTLGEHYIDANNGDELGPLDGAVYTPGSVLILDTGSDNPIRYFDSDDDGGQLAIGALPSGKYSFTSLGTYDFTSYSFGPTTPLDTLNPGDVGYVAPDDGGGDGPPDGGSPMDGTVTNSPDGVSSALIASVGGASDSGISIAVVIAAIGLVVAAVLIGLRLNRKRVGAR